MFEVALARSRSGHCNSAEVAYGLAMAGQPIDLFGVEGVVGPLFLVATVGMQW